MHKNRIQLENEGDNVVLVPPVDHFLCNVLVIRLKKTMYYVIFQVPISMALCMIVLRDIFSSCLKTIAIIKQNLSQIKSN